MTDAIDPHRKTVSVAVDRACHRRMWPSEPRGISLPQTSATNCVSY